MKLKGATQTLRRALVLCAVAGFLCLFTECIFYPEDDTAEKDKPIPIRTLDELNAVRYNLDKNYILESSIVIIDKWTPIGTGSTPFNGVFDGNSKAISFGPYSGLNPIAISEGELAAGLFGVVSVSGVVKDLTMRDLKAQVNTDTYSGYDLKAGSIAGINTGTIANCALERGDIEISSKNVNSGAVELYLGGICGVNAGTVSGCYVFNSKLYANNLNEGQNSLSFAGGIAGLNESNGPLSAEIKNCYSAPDGSSSQVCLTQSSTPSNYSYSGGIAGVANGAAISDCWSSAKLDAGAHGGGAGGIVGYTLANPDGKPALIQGCVALNREIAGLYTGRIIGHMDVGTTYVDVYGGGDTILSSGSDQSKGRNEPAVSSADRKEFSWWINTGKWTLIYPENINAARPDRPWVWRENDCLPYLYWESIW
jgi:hypothetical protein